MCEHDRDRRLCRDCGGDPSKTRLKCAHKRSRNACPECISVRNGGADSLVATIYEALEVIRPFTGLDLPAELNKGEVTNAVEKLRSAALAHAPAPYDQRKRGRPKKTSANQGPPRKRGRPRKEPPIDDGKRNATCQTSNDLDFVDSIDKLRLEMLQHEVQAQHSMLVTQQEQIRVLEEQNCIHLTMQQHTQQRHQMQLKQLQEQVIQQQHQHQNQHQHRLVQSRVGVGSAAIGTKCAMPVPNRAVPRLQVAGMAAGSEKLGAAPADNAVGGGVASGMCNLVVEKGQKKRLTDFEKLHRAYVEQVGRRC